MNDEDRRKYCNLCGRNIGCRTRGGMCDVCLAAYKKGSQDERSKIDKKDIRYAEAVEIVKFQAENAELKEKNAALVGLIEGHRDEIAELRKELQELNETENGRIEEFERMVFSWEKICMEHEARWDKIHKMIKVELVESEKSKNASNCSLLLIGIEKKMSEPESGISKTDIRSPNNTKSYCKDISIESDGEIRNRDMKGNAYHKQDAKAGKEKT